MRQLLHKNEYLGLFIIGLLFIISAYFAQKYSTSLNILIESHPTTGPLIYIFLAILATVVAPISATPLIPIATMLWGPLIAGILSIIGWSIGSIIAFKIARTYGQTFVLKSERIRTFQKYIDAIPSRKFFWTIVLLRTALPVDLLSYALGLFSKISLQVYILTTLIGITPFAFIFAYTSTMPLSFQVFVLIGIGLFLFIEYRQIEKGFINNK